MPDTQDLCPNQSDGNHRYFVFKTAEVFVPQDPERTGQTDVTTTLYEKIEQAVLGCNCGSVIKRVVQV